MGDVGGMTGFEHLVLDGSFGRLLGFRHYRCDKNIMCMKELFEFLILKCKENVLLFILNFHYTTDSSSKNATSSLLLIGAFLVLLYHFLCMV